MKRLTHGIVVAVLLASNCVAAEQHVYPPYPDKTSLGSPHDAPARLLGTWSPGATRDPDGDLRITRERLSYSDCLYEEYRLIGGDGQRTFHVQVVDPHCRFGAQGLFFIFEFSDLARPEEDTDVILSICHDRDQFDRPRAQRRCSWGTFQKNQATEPFQELCEELRVQHSTRERLAAYALEGQQSEDGTELVSRVDIDGDGIDDVVTTYCPGSGSIVAPDPCTLEFTPSSSRKSFSIEEQRLYPFRYQGRVYVVAGSTESETAPTLVDIYLLSGDAAARICSFECGESSACEARPLRPGRNQGAD
jgi:hypothetical protein